jgi:hypothetical protein
VASTLREIEARLLAVMPVESTIDRGFHALAVASVVFASRRRAALKRQAGIAETRAHAEMTRELTQLLRERIRVHGSADEPG